jgi:hypothetical protein
MGDCGYLTRMVFSSDDGGDFSLDEDLEGEGLEAPVPTPTVVPPTTVVIPPLAPSGVGCE